MAPDRVVMALLVMVSVFVNIAPVAGVVSFNMEGIHPHDVAQILDLSGVAIRAGHHCCQPLMQKLGVAATNRASFYLYTVQDEVDQLVDGLHAVKKVFA